MELHAKIETIFQDIADLLFPLILGMPRPN